MIKKEVEHTETGALRFVTRTHDHDGHSRQQKILQRMTKKGWEDVPQVGEDEDLAHLE